MSVSSRFTIAIHHDPTYVFPWHATLRDYTGDWILRSRGKSVSDALDSLAGRLRDNLHWGQEQINEVLATAAIERDCDIVRAAGEELTGNEWDTIRYAAGYAKDMNDENASPEPKLPLLRCESCGISSDSYPNGDATQIGDRVNRHGIVKKLCHVCGIEEQVEILKAKRYGTSADPARTFDHWLIPGDRVRAAGVGVRLDGDLPEVDNAARAKWGFELARSLGEERM